jgi:hypothetical protein
MSRTIMDFRVPGDVWPFIDQWAPSANFHIVQSAGPMRLYQRGYGFWTAPVMASFQQSGDVVHMETWVRCNLLVRIMSLFILPKEMELRSGGFRAVLPRKLGRDGVNKLLEQLKLPLIP